MRHGLCVSCKFVEMRMGADKIRWFWCHRFPPQATSNGEGDRFAAFSEVAANDWCGEHKPKRKR